MAIIETNYDVGDLVYTTFGHNLEFVEKITMVKITEVGYNGMSVVYYYEESDNREILTEYTIIGRTKVEVISYINKFFNERIDSLDFKRLKLLAELEKGDGD